jgi:hypothetical protein
MAARRSWVAAAAVVTLMTQGNMIKMIMFDIVWQGATGWPLDGSRPPQKRYTLSGNLQARSWSNVVHFPPPIHTFRLSTRKFPSLLQILCLHSNYNL